MTILWQIDPATLAASNGLADGAAIADGSVLGGFTFSNFWQYTASETGTGKPALTSLYQSPSSGTLYGAGLTRTATYTMHLVLAFDWDATNADLDVATPYLYRENVDGFPPSIEVYTRIDRAAGTFTPVLGFVAEDGTPTEGTSTVALTKAARHLVSVVVTPGSIALYCDGALSATISATLPSSTGAELRMDPSYGTTSILQARGIDAAATTADMDALLAEYPALAATVLSWAAPAHDGGSPVTAYEIYTSRGTVVLGPDVLSHEMIVGTGGADVVAVNAAGRSAPLHIA